MVKYAEKNLKNPPANGKQGPAALNKKKQYNLDPMHRGVGFAFTATNIKKFSFSTRASKKF
jgi:hypothetical protein